MVQCAGDAHILAAELYFVNFFFQFDGVPFCALYLYII